MPGIERTRMLKVGDPVPEFAAETTDGKPISAALLRGRTFVVFFFPRAYTPGCVREAKAFRDAYPGLRARGVEVVGVSTDPHATQCAFSEWAGLSYPMIGDSSCALARAFGVLWPLFSVTKRATFVFDGAGIVRAAFHFEVAIDRHLSEVHRALGAMDLVAV